MEWDHQSEHQDEEMLQIQTNLDDMNPEWLPGIMQKLFAVGANDVFAVPILMKKGRSGLMLNVLCERKRLTEVEKVLFMETTTFGLRYMPVTCHRLGRDVEVVHTKWGDIPVKVAYSGQQMAHFAPEYDACQEIAVRNDIPLHQVYDAARHAFLLLHPNWIGGKR